VEKEFEDIRREYYEGLVSSSVSAIFSPMGIGVAISDIILIHNLKLDKSITVPIIGAMLFTIFFLIASKVTVNYFKDFRYIKEKNFIHITVTIGKISNVGAELFEQKHKIAFVNTETGERISIRLPGNNVKTGEIYEVMYLPHTKHGSYVRKIEG